jgi:hypothetical protein
MISLRSSPQADSDSDRELDDQLQRRHRFADFTQRLTIALADGTISLREATERLFYFCLEAHPRYLDNVWEIESGQHVKTKIAQNLVRWARSADNSTKQDAMLARLEHELRELPYDDEADQTLTAQ